MKNLVREWLFPPSIYFYLRKYRQMIRSFFKYSSKDFKKNIELKNKHTGQRCFILGTGPSIAKQDLTLLKDEVVIGVSGLFNHKDIDIIQPDYYVLAPVFSYHLKYNKKETYIHWLQSMDKVLSDTVIMILHIGDKEYIDTHNIFSNKKIYWNNYSLWDGANINKIELSNLPDIYSVSETALSVGLYLGFEKIYMLGFDHDWFDGLHVYFDTEKYNKYFEISGEESAKKFGFDAEFQMRRHAYIFSKYKKLYNFKNNIYNANRNLKSYVDTFPKVKFEELF